MPRGISLTEFQKDQAIAYRNDGKAIREIAGILKIGKSAIAEFLKNPDAHGKRKKTGRPRKLTPKEQRNLLRQLKKRRTSIPTAQRESGLTHITRQISFNYVQRSKQFQFKKRKHHPKWTKIHIAYRLAWGKKYMSWTTEWTSVIFSDEKRFNLVGPDGFQYYWHCLKQKEQYYSTRQQGIGSLMVWPAVGFGGRSSLVFIKGRQNHKDYIQQLETELLPYGSD
ncbi:Transposable element Tc3 transposase [Araneus ventricosus]|uniref:Transposable element Tc3 transposase n=1 Tax=Araneus ventricosus TaxID=182803 RepID=A0A4Y2G4G6_ARAVE|nr:Transposable element Tc3 transposase [Araneus ventricosus]